MRVYYIVHRHILHGVHTMFAWYNKGMSTNHVDHNKYVVQQLERYAQDVMLITKLDHESAQKLIKLLHSNDSQLTVEAAMREVGLDTTNTTMVQEFMNYWEYADTDER